LPTTSSTPIDFDPSLLELAMATYDRASHNCQALRLGEQWARGRGGRGGGGWGCGTGAPHQAGRGLHSTTSQLNLSRFVSEPFCVQFMTSHDPSIC
jgi:hypothetical protein